MKKLWLIAKLCVTYLMIILLVSCQPLALLTKLQMPLVPFINIKSVVKNEGKFGRLSDSFTFKSVHPELVFKKLKSINVRKATGHDNVPGKLLRVAHLELSIPFAKLINECFIQSTFQDLLKCAKLNPIYKKSDSLQNVYYRPASVLTIISKLYESVMNNQMTEHLIEI